MARVRSKLFRLADAVSQLFNVLIFNGEPNHSVSGDAFRYNRIRTKAFIDWFFLKFFKEEEHCKSSHLNDVARGCELCKETKNDNL